MPDYEVIVVGAGPAGAMITKELVQRNFAVLCVEKEVEVGYTNKSTASTPLDTFETFEIPRELAFEDLKGARIFGPTKDCVIELEGTVGRVLRFRELKQYLIREAIKNGAHVVLGAEVKSAIVKKGQILGIKYHGRDGTIEVTANVVVDASGPQGILSTSFGLWKKKPKQIGLAFEYFMEGVKPVVAKSGGYYMDFFMGSARAPGGYGWIFPTGPTEAKAGMCKLLATHKVPNELSQREYFNKIWHEDPQLTNAQPFELHECAHYITDPVDHSVLDNFVAVGDAVNKVHPLFGEGIRASFYSARYAAMAIEEARKLNDYSAPILGLYDKMWKKKWNKNWRFARHAQKSLYSANDRALDLLIEKLGKMNPEVLFRLYLGQATPKDYLVMARSIPSMVDRKTIGSILRRLR